MSDLEKIKTEIALVKKDAKTGELIHQRLEVAVDKLTEITVSLKGMIAQQQTKLERAEQTDDDIFVTLESRRKEWDNDLIELHSRISTQGKELRPNYFGENAYFQKLSNQKCIPVYDVIGEINSTTYEYDVNNTGKNDYSKLIKKIQEEIK